MEQTYRSELGRKFRWMKGSRCSQSLYGLVAPHHGEQGVASNTRRPNNQTIGGFLLSNSRLIEIKMDRGALSIRIECEHGSIVALDTMNSTDPVALRYMVKEIQRAKFNIIDLSYEEIVDGEL